MTNPAYEATNRRNKVYPVNDSFVIADEGGWLPGSYASREAANKAHEIKHLENWGILQRLQDEANERAGGVGGDITLEDLSGVQHD
ncbi:hypothetical protein GJV07_22000 [Enterobacteriaceae bacterium RIT711]|nr:hypothetical protein [Enterobacteriaceae bacterium RIT711]